MLVMDRLHKLENCMDSASTSSSATIAEWPWMELLTAWGGDLAVVGGCWSATGSTATASGAQRSSDFPSSLTWGAHMNSDEGHSSIQFARWPHGDALTQSAMLGTTSYHQPDLELSKCWSGKYKAGAFESTALIPRPTNTHPKPAGYI